MTKLNTWTKSSAETSIMWSQNFKRSPHYHMRIISRVREIADKTTKLQNLSHVYNKFMEKFPHWVNCVSGNDFIENKQYIKVTFDGALYYVVCWVHFSAGNWELNKHITLNIFQDEDIHSTRYRIIDLYADWRFIEKSSKFSAEEVKITSAVGFLQSFDKRIGESKL